jgi:hypothetical protein
MSRNYKDFLSAYLMYTEKTEPPLNFHIWTCLSVLGAALQRKVYLKWGFNTLYPNLYVVFIGPSACGKGVAMKRGKELLDPLEGISTVPESITREALIRAFADSSNDFLDSSDSLVKSHCSMAVFSEELSVFLGQQNIKFIADLTDLYDCKDRWEYKTKGSGIDILNNVCFTMLGACAPDWLKSILPSEAFGGGFTSRIIFIVEEGPRQRIADPTIPPEVLAMKEKLTADLEEISQLTGEFSFPKATMEFYSDWYYKQKAPLSDPTFAGYCGRRNVHILKLSMLCSISRSNEKVVEVKDLERAIALLTSVEPKMPRAFMGVGKARYGEATERIFDYLSKVKTASVADILEKFHLDLDEYTLSIALKTLSARNRIDITRTSSDTMVYFKERREEHEMSGV